MKALVEMKDMLKYENEKLKQEKEELIKWLEEMYKCKNDIVFWASPENENESKVQSKLIKIILSKLKESDK